MIKSLRCDQPTFQTVVFGPGLNIILADRTKEETKKNSRNGLGKSTFVELVHFCLGSDFRGMITAAALKDWTFTLDLEIRGEPISVSRNTGSPSKVMISGDTRRWPKEPKLNKQTGFRELAYKDWTEVLGILMFGLASESGKYRPTFRSLISYFARRGKDAYSTPFEIARKQNTGTTQVLNTFLLNLEYHDAIDFQSLRDRKETLQHLRKLLTDAKTAKEVLGSLGEYEARKVRLEVQAKREAQELLSFRVHPQYEEIARSANSLTERIHEWANDNVVDKRLVELYEQNLAEEKAPMSDEVASMYARAGAELPTMVKRRLDDVQTFHRSLVANRRSFLASEIKRLNQTIEKRSSEIHSLTDKRAVQMDVLKTHGALDEHTALVQRNVQTKAELEGVLERIRTIKQLQEGESALKIDRELLVQRARRDLAERAVIRDKAIELFNANSQALYEAPGTLAVDVGDTGFRFNLDIQRSGSGGVGNMKVFCYDLMIAQLWSERTCSPGFLMHDSLIWDGVDERQRALAIELAAGESRDHGFQYICSMNSDAVPSNDFSSDFKLDDYVRLRLSDEQERSRLVGMYFEVEGEDDESAADAESAAGAMLSE